jgi:hypothetical protein
MFSFSRVSNAGVRAVALGVVCCSAALCLGQTPADPASHPVGASTSQGVSYQNGRLGIQSEGATLADVLHSVAQKIGAVIEVPAGSGNERIIEHASGAADEVLTSLLSGSEFNFVIVTSPGSPHVPTRVLLTPRSGGSTQSPEVAQMQPAGSTEPELYGGGFSVNPEDEQQQPVQAAVPPPTTASGEQLSPDAIEAMVKERLRLRHQQQESQAQTPPPQ